MLSAPSQLALIDRAAGAQALAKDVGNLYDAVRGLEDELAALEKNESELLQHADLLRFQRDEIDRHSQERVRPSNSERSFRYFSIRKDFSRPPAAATNRLYESEASVLSHLAGLERTLREVQTYDSRLRDITEQAATARALVEDLAYALRDYLNQLDVDPENSNSTNPVWPS